MVFSAFYPDIVAEETPEGQFVVSFTFVPQYKDKNQAFYHGSTVQSISDKLRLERLRSRLPRVGRKSVNSRIMRRINK